MATTRPIRLAVTLGDPSGIGPEIAARLAAAPPAGVHLVFVGAREALERERGVVPGLPTLEAFTEARGTALSLHDDAALPQAPLPAPGEIHARAGRLSHTWVMQGARLCSLGLVDALVTGPIQKEAWKLAGIASPGHTEALRDEAGAARVLMLLVGKKLRTALATIHIPLREVPGRLSCEGLLADLRLLAREIARDFGPASPRLAVCGLNPHAGEGGLLGEEDDAVIRPAVLQAIAEGIQAVGPLPADACIPQAAQGRYDAVLAMYHDQALPAVKALAHRQAVNVTLGLPYVRTSVDHGTAMDIAGRGLASERSLRAAVALAKTLVIRRRRSEGRAFPRTRASTERVPPPT